MQMIDSNSFYLNNYLHNQDILEEEWQMTKQVKQDFVVDFAREILLQNVDRNTFDMVFGYYLNESTDKEEWFISVLEDIELGVADPELKDAIIREALYGASSLLYDCELEELLDYRLQYAPQLEIMIKEVGL